ncbi:putative hemolysin [Chloroflexus sp.]|uniref:putative hemolysin n=1 Tax=Chloroflexus sp. TaxID=1904827 RepID=UPI0026061B62|nr:DUF333 domain-containing protein [uncultured Chloroflexus sp.]
MKAHSFLRVGLFRLLIALNVLPFIAGCSLIPVASPTPAASQMPAASPTLAASPTPAASPAPLPTATVIGGLANPASTYCVEQGGRLEIQAVANEGQVGVCLFADGSLCDEWAFFRNECRPGEQYELSLTDPITEIAATPLSNALGALQASLPANAFARLAAQPLATDDGRQLWVFYSAGMRPFDLDPPPSHFIAVYACADDECQELDRQELRQNFDVVDLEPDFIDSVQQVQIAPGRIWIQVEGGMGAHSGTYHLFSFDGRALRLEVVAFSSSPGVGRIEDLNGDGLNEVVLDRSERYVFCYACGVYYPAYEVYTWQDQALIRLELGDLTIADQTVSFAELNRQAIAFAQADLWPEALTAIDAAVAQAGSADPPATAGSLRWNQRLIQLTHDAHLAAIEQSAYPLLNEVFFGAYERAVDRMRAYPPEAIFNAESPLIAGTVAQGWLPEFSSYLTGSADRALAVAPDRAAIYVIRAWGRFLLDPADPGIGVDLSRAAQLQPDDTLLIALASWWERRDK